VADTTSASADYEPLRLTVTLADGRLARTSGAASFTTDPRDVLVGDGIVRVDGRRIEPSAGELSCGRGSGLGDDGSLGGTDVGEPTDERDETTTTTAASGGEQTTTSSTVPATGDTTTTTTTIVDPVLPTTTTTGPAATTTSTVPGVTSTTAPPTTTTTTAPNAPPRILRFITSPAAISQASRTGGCGSPTTAQVVAEVRDADDPTSSLTVRFRYVLDSDPSVQGEVTMVLSGGSFVGTIGPFAQGTVPAAGGTFTLTGLAADPHGGQATPVTTTLSLTRC
jgi:hypothetical protein